MTAKPRIAVPVPTSFDQDYNRRCWPQFRSAVELAGGEAVAVPLELLPREIAELANTCQAVLLPGSPADVNPEKYGQERMEGTAQADLPRENCDELLLQDAHNLYKPIFTVCFGTQMLNVWRSGTLVQDLTVMPVNHNASKVAIAHSVAVRADSVLGETVRGDAEEAPDVEGYARLPINSSHHQAIGIPGDGLRVVARCPQDGVIEAVEGGQANSQHNSEKGRPEHFVLGVQWHPERTCEESAASRALFGRFVEEARQWTPRAVRTSVG